MTHVHCCDEVQPQAEDRIVLLEAVVREAAAHVGGLLTIDTARYGARDWLRELPERTGLTGLYQRKPTDD